MFSLQNARKKYNIRQLFNYYTIQLLLLLENVYTSFQKSNEKAVEYRNIELNRNFDRIN